KYYVSNAPVGTSVKQMILWAHQRWKVEQGYQHMKEELGLDHFEGRSWRGLHHHVTLCFMAYCFLMLIRHRKKSQLDLARNQKVA
ncbi:MAG TPA: transposase, partial [Pyrinomonadaceae bacterium]